MTLLFELTFLLIGACISSIYHLAKIEDLEEELQREKLRTRDLELTISKMQTRERVTNFIRNSK